MAELQSHSGCLNVTASCVATELELRMNLPDDWEDSESPTPEWRQTRGASRISGFESYCGPPCFSGRQSREDFDLQTLEQSNLKPIEL